MFLNYLQLAYVGKGEGLIKTEIELSDVNFMYNKYTNCSCCETIYNYFVRSKNIGLGNGQRKSSEFEEYVLEKRKYLRDNLKLCERATQRVLLYSNNFLHKKLKTDPSVSY